MKIDIKEDTVTYWIDLFELPSLGAFTVVSLEGLMTLPAENRALIYNALEKKLITHLIEHRTELLPQFARLPQKAVILIQDEGYVTASTRTADLKKILQYEYRQWAINEKFNYSVELTNFLVKISLTLTIIGFLLDIPLGPLSFGALVLFGLVRIGIWLAKNYHENT